MMYDPQESLPPAYRRKGTFEFKCVIYKYTPFSGLGLKKGKQYSIEAHQIQNLQLELSEKEKTIKELK